MDSDYRYAIVGTGAIGGFYGARLQQAGKDVHYLLRSDYDHVIQHGLTIESPDGNFQLPQVHAYSDVAQMPACDVVIVALKTTQNHLLPRLLPNLVKPDGVVLVLQNGLNIEPMVAEIVGSDRVMGGLCFICSNKIGPGHIRHLDYKAIALGEYGPKYAAQGLTERLQRIAQDFEAAEIPIQKSDDLLKTRWRKLLWNIPFNGLSVALDATTDEMISDPAIYQLATHLMKEVLSVARAYGRDIGDRALHENLDHTAQMKPYKTSMKIDFDEGRPLELDAIFGQPIAAAQQRLIAVPLITALYQQLLFLDRRNQRAIASKPLA
jgi:2-dehydropantoate 2-reductase